ncbi:hypothetical protein ELI01_18875 [Rhizobium leguminosarum]|uniref:hypothetical protein n=1 Tax=Rhizobium leguminosarum TaxID=384 RepID=UPI00102F715F|nr:hypothetical protein [Rhizobium leguminosarum]TAX57142.1 hypothetical protein ELI01_18875 [Rhizobium leguminosarum]
MTEAKHTPGPWRYDVESEAVFADDGDVCPNVVFLNDNTSGDQNLADGTLIASSPDLLAALKIAEKHIASVCGETSEDDLPEWFNDLKTIRAAIAKATD